MIAEWYEYGLWGLFLASFLAATVLPLASEAFIGTMVSLGFDVWTCVVVATMGNWLGGLTSYFLGYLGKWQWIESKLGMEREKVEKWREKANKYGSYFALFSWAPLVGDVIAIALGFARTNFWFTSFFMLVGKALRYIVIAWSVAQFV